MDFYVFLVTVPNIEEGKKIARVLVECKLAACVNIIHNAKHQYDDKYSNPFFQIDPSVSQSNY